LIDDHHQTWGAHGLVKTTREVFFGTVMEVGSVVSSKRIDSMASGSNEVDGCIDEIRTLLHHATNEQSCNPGPEKSRFQVRADQ
jgi:hypothetical protein